MRFFSKSKDGGPYSTVTGYWLVEIKGLFSVALLHFGPGSREEYHDHAFDAISWLLKGRLEEHHLNGDVQIHKPRLRPILTWKDTFHKVFSNSDSWALTFRGPWNKTWHEYDPKKEQYITLADGREVVEVLDV